MTGIGREFANSEFDAAELEAITDLHNLPLHKVLPIRHVMDLRDILRDIFLADFVGIILLGVFQPV